jgi:CubicO group peptidase (beta-lactamase class C family)
MKFRLLVLFYLVLCPASFLISQTQSALAPDVAARVDSATEQRLAAAGVPSASIAVVRDGRIAYLHAYGKAHLEPDTAANSGMRYSIGSISKQFTAAAILMLAEQGKLSLDDPVARFVPDLTRAKEVTIRQLLSHTSGFQDYWPQDYVPPFMLQPVTAQKILDQWARKPLDFDPGTQWQYSNTGYVVAGLIVEKASGQPLLEFLRQHIFTPLQMKSVMNIDQETLNDTDATGYLRYGLGPLRVAPKEGKGWLFAAGELAMTAEDLAKWDVSLINQSLMKPASYHEMQTTVLLKNGTSTDYGLGVDVRDVEGHRMVEHGGEVSGFTSENVVFPDDRIAVVVFTNEDAVGTSAMIARKISGLLLPQEDQSKEEEQARNIFQGLQNGTIDRTLFTDNANSYFTDQALKDLASGLGPLGAPVAVIQTAKRERGGMTFRRFEVKFSSRNVQIWERILPNGKIEQFQILPTD